MLKEKKEESGKIEFSKGPWYFLLGVILLWIIIFFINKELIFKSSSFFLNIIVKILPIIALVFVLMFIVNYFIKPEKLVSFFGKESKITWLIAIITGIISTGPIYMWYPLLGDLQKKGIKNGFIATFLYNRAIKIPLLPLVIFYFGLTYVLILLSVMMVMSVVQGITINKILRNEK